jgi:hypothetical protein
MIRSTDDPDFFEAMNEKQIRWRITVACTPPICKCNGTTRTGLPCADLIALYDQHSHRSFPVAFISRRWLPDSNIAPLSDLPALSLEDIDELTRSETDDAIEMADAIQFSVDDEEDTLEHAGGEEDGHVALGDRDTAAKDISICSILRSRLPKKVPMLLANMISAISDENARVIDRSDGW